MAPDPASRDRTVGARCRRRGHRAFCAALLLGWSIGVVAAGSDDADEDIAARERDLQTLEQRVQEIGAELAGRSDERRTLIAELEGREREVATQALASRDVARRVKEQTRVAETLRARELEEQRLLAAELDRLKVLLRTAYALGRADALRLVLNRQDPARASRVLSYVAYINRERMLRLQAVQSTARRIADLAWNAEREAERLARLAQEQEAALRGLESAKAQRAEVLASLERAIASGQETLAGLARDADNLRLLVEHLRQRAQIRAELEVQRDPFVSLRGRLHWPLVEGRVRAAFGSPREEPGLVLDGVLLAAREGEEVRAVYDGRVVYADWLVGFGMLLVIDHGDGYMTLYGHNEALLKDVGEWVGAGEPIALGGSSGGRDEPVLYFAIRHNGEPLDPGGWCG